MDLHGFFMGSSHENSTRLWAMKIFLVFHGYFMVYDPPMKISSWVFSWVFHNYHWCFIAYSPVVLALVLNCSVMIITMNNQQF